MKSSLFGVLAAGAFASVAASAALAGSPEGGGSGAKACYRSHCGKSIKGYEGKCGGTKVEGLADEKACTAAGGAWTTEADAAKFKKQS